MRQRRLSLPCAGSPFLVPRAAGACRQVTLFPMNATLTMVRARRVRTELIDRLRRRAERRPALGVLNLVLAGLWLVGAYFDGVTTVIGGNRVMLFNGVLDVVAAGCFLVVGWRYFSPKPADQLLLCLVEEADARDAGPNAARGLRAPEGERAGSASP